MQNLRISAAVREKLANKHNVTEAEICQCFFNHMGQSVVDTRENHQTDPETLAFIAETNRGRELKVIFMLIDGNIHIKSAYEPSEEDKAFYEAGQR